MYTQDFTWLAADYHIPITYSCRIPMSSPNSALAMPAPGPGTVRLAMVRVGTELFGQNYVRNDLYHTIRSAEIHIRPPDRVAISSHLFHSYKATEGSSGGNLIDSLSYREICHAEGLITVFVKVPANHKQPFQEILEAIGYWGQSNSLACCIAVNPMAPKMGECAIPFTAWTVARPIQSFFSCFVSDFRDGNVEWDEIMPVLREEETTAIRLQVWVWPLVVIEQWSNHKLLVRCSLE